MRAAILKEDVKPLSDHIEGKLVVIGTDGLNSKYKFAKYQLVLATGGFGCDAGKLGNAVYVTECHKDNPESYRQERYNLIGEPTEQLILAWLREYGEFNETVQKILNGGN